MFRSFHHQELKTAYTATVYVKQLLLPAALGNEMDLFILVKRSTCFGLSIIRSSKLRIQQRFMSNSCCYLLLLGMRWNALHVSDDLSVHHQELKTAYTATVYVQQLLLPAAIGYEMERSCLPYTVAVYAVLSS